MDHHLQGVQEVHLALSLQGQQWMGEGGREGGSEGGGREGGGERWRGE